MIMSIQMLSSPVTWDIATTELSSLTASSTRSRLGLSFFFRMAVAKSSDLKTKAQY